MRTQRSAWMIGACIAACFILTGCSGPTLPIYEKEQSPEDTIPDVIPAGDANEYIDRDSARYVGETDGAKLFATRDAKGRDVCFAAVKGMAWATSCSLDGTSFEMEIQGVVFVYDPEQECNGMTEMTPGICVA